VPGDREQGRQGTLWLVPGHLGEPRDLGPRSLQVLRGARAWLVEPGSERAVAKTAERLGLTPPPLHPLRDGLQPDDPVLLSVLSVLDAGGDVALFGAEEGVVGWADPGSDWIAEVSTRRPSVAVRSVGGPSVLGTALMRVPRHLNHVLVLGTVASFDGRAPQRLTDVLRFGAQGRLPTAWLVTGTVAKAMAAHIATMRPPMAVDAWFMVHLTRPEEQVVQATLGPDTASAFDAIDDAAPGVLVMVPSWAPDRGRAWWFRLWYRLWRGRAVFRA